MEKKYETHLSPRGSKTCKWNYNSWKTAFNLSTMYLSFFENIQGHDKLYFDKILQEMFECVKIGYLAFDNPIILKAKYLILCLNMQLIRNHTSLVSETKFIICVMITWPTFFCLCCTFVVISKSVTHETARNVNWIWPHYYFKDIQIFF